MAKCAGPRLPLLMKALVCTQDSVYEIQRVTSTAFLAEVGPLSHSGMGRDAFVLWLTEPLRWQTGSLPRPHKSMLSPTSQGRAPSRGRPAPRTSEAPSILPALEIESLLKAVTVAG
jgi:hypothetical protein